MSVWYSTSEAQGTIVIETIHWKAIKGERYKIREQININLIHFYAKSSATCKKCLNEVLNTKLDLKQKQMEMMGHW